MRAILKQAEQFAYRFADTSGAGDYVNTMTQAITPPAPTGLTNAQNYAQGLSGHPYDYGGAGQPGRGVDCSGYMSGIYNNLTGKNERFTTDSNFQNLGFQPGYDPSSHFNIGTNGGSGEQGHMAGELAGTNVESASATGHHPGATGTMYGGEAYGPNHPLFTQQWHLPNSMVVNKPPAAAAPSPPKPPPMPSFPGSH